MSADEALQGLAARAGVALRWTDAFGRDQETAVPTLRRVLAALDLPAGNEAQVRDSARRLDDDARLLPPCLTADQGEPVHLPRPPGRVLLHLEDGRRFDRLSEADGAGSRLPPVLEPGLHRLETDAGETLLAVAPPRCPTATELAGAPAWGLAVQLYGLRRRGDGGLGDFLALEGFVREAAAQGAAAVAISPVHAQFSADLDRFSPYSPSSRSMLNVLHAPLDLSGEEADHLERLDLVDWPAASRLRLARLRALHAAMEPDERRAFDAFRTAAGSPLEDHARFEAMHAVMFARDAWHWRDWPEPLRDPRGEAVRDFARGHAGEVEFHAYAQFRADRGLGAAQAAARDAGMAIGLVADLAVGSDSGGSQCWSRQAEFLTGMNIGAPPDLLSRDGQDWGLCAFSPRGLRASGFAAFREMLDAALRHAGGVRVDHAMGLNRLWVVPDGHGAAEGAYLSFPEADLLRLIRLAAHRHRALVMGEDLGTVPEGFGERLSGAGVAGMRVLWFERDKAGNFTSPRDWTRRAVAMTSTHDLPTVAGWWTGTDLEWRARLGLMRDEVKERAERDADRGALWSAMVASGAAAGPAPDAADAVADAAARQVGRSACDMVVLPVEDALGLEQQPNLPGTLDQHPNWRRRLPKEAGTVLEAPDVRRRLGALADSRRDPPAA